MEHCAEPKLRCAGISRSYKGTWTVYLLIRAVARFIFVFINNLYGIPTYLLWMLLLRPLLWHQKTVYVYWWLEGWMFKFLLMQVGSWMWAADYKVCAVGEDIWPILKDRCLVVCNHQSTGDVPLVMYALQGYPAVANKVMWIMDIMFKYSNFGFVSQVHGDFFIQQGKATRHMQLNRLRDHLRTVYTEHQMEWIVLFPEGGFLRKRRENSNAFAAKNGYPRLEHVTLPRVGAMKVCLDTLAKQLRQNGYTHTAVSNSTSNGVKPANSGTLKWVVDVTIGYPQGQPLDMFSITFGDRPPCTTQLLYRIYPVSELPHGEDELLQWMYQRYMEKEIMLDEFYATGEFPALDGSKCYGQLIEGKRYSSPNIPLVIALNLFGIGTVYTAWKYLMLILTPFFFMLGW